MFDEFDFKVLDDPDFKEDSVREELVLPIVKALGYEVTGDARVIRSKSLIHPYVAIGSKQRKISIIPDYLFLSEGKPYWVLDAKSPGEEVTKSKHVEQAYSYAIHPEVRADFYALCNGKEFVLHSISKFEPVLKFKLCDIDEYWELLLRLLHPEIKAHPDVVDFYPDYGLHLKKLGAEDGFKYIAIAINTNYIAKVQDGLYTTSTVVRAEREYAMSLDFGEEEFKQLLNILPDEKALVLSNGLKRQPYQVHFEGGEELRFGAASKLTNEIFHNPQESYLPFKVMEFFQYMELPAKNEQP